MARIGTLVVAAVALAFGYAPWSKVRAVDPQPPIAFVTVDAFSVAGSYFTVTGIAQGDAAASAKTFYSPSPSWVVPPCQQMALLAMSKPGAYVFEVTQPYLGSIVTCKLSRVNP